MCFLHKFVMQFSHGCSHSFEYISNMVLMKMILLKVSGENGDNPLLDLYDFLLFRLN